jgi:hypothetical protein
MRCEIVIGKEKANRKKLDTKIKKDLTRILRRITGLGRKRSRVIRPSCDFAA